MVRDKALREGEVVVDTPKANDAGLVFIGRIRTPWTSREDTRGRDVMTARSAGWRFSSPGCPP